MGILALAEIALAETGPEAERGDVRSVNGGVVVLYERAETLEDEEIWRDAGSDLETSAASAATDAWIATAPMLRLMANSATPAVRHQRRFGTRRLLALRDGAHEAVRSESDVEVRKIDSMKDIESDLQIVLRVSAAAVEQQDDQLKSAYREWLEAHRC